MGPPGKIWGSALYRVFFSSAAFKKQNPAQTLWQHQRNSKQFVVKQPFNNAIFPYASTSEICGLLKKTSCLAAKRAEKSKRRELQPGALLGNQEPPPPGDSAPHRFSLHRRAQWCARHDNRFTSRVIPHCESLYVQITTSILVPDTF